MSTSEKKVAANRRNAQKSTGPRTKIGKKHMRMNALRHAIYADPKNLPGEDPQQTSELVKQVREQLQPQGPVETVVADQIVSIIQELHRIDRAYHVYRAGKINDQAVLRQREREITELERSLHTDNFSDAWQANQEIERIKTTTKPMPQASDLDSVLSHTISDEREATVADYVDRRQRLLLRDLEHAYCVFR
jgi:hypothetical protein